MYQHAHIYHSILVTAFGGQTAVGADSMCMGANIQDQCKPLPLFVCMRTKAICMTSDTPMPFCVCVYAHTHTYVRTEAISVTPDSLILLTISSICDCTYDRMYVCMCVCVRMKVNVNLQTKGQLGIAFHGMSMPAVWV
jgi:hypothetical protein